MRCGRVVWGEGGVARERRGAHGPAPGAGRRGPARVLLAAAFAWIGASSAVGQTRPAPRETPRAAPSTPAAGAPQATGATPTAPAAADREPEPPYEPQLMRLAEVLGALSYLSSVCRPSADGGAASAGGVDWRDRMSQLVQAEAPSPARRERLAGAFNRGFLGYAGAHHTCTSATELAAARHVEEGARLTRELASRFGS